MTAAVVVAAAVGIWSQVHNREVRPLYEAVATVTFGVEEGRNNASTVTEPLNAAAVIATAANDDAIAAGFGRVGVDERASALRLTARADQREQAIARATEMREAYFRTAAEQGEATLEAKIDDIVAEATVLFDRLEELQPDDQVLPTLSEADQARLDFMSVQVDALKQRSSQLFGDLILAQVGDDRVASPEEIQEELDLIESALEALYIEIAELDPTGQALTGSRAPAASSTTDRDASTATEDTPPEDLERDWTITAIQGRLDELQAEYEDLFISLGSTESDEAISATAGPVNVTDIGDPRLPVFLLAAIGLIGGALIGTGIAFAEDRLRRRLLVAADIPSSRLLAEMPSWRLTMLQSSRRSKAFASRGGRLDSKRFTAVKALRQSIMGLTGQWGGPAIIGIGGSNVDHAEVEALALEVALSVAATDRTVLLLDLDLKSDPAVIGDGSGTSVATILDRLRRNGGVSTTELESAFQEAVPVAPSLRMITSGTPTGEPADLVLTSSFELLLAAAKHQADVVMAIVPELTSPEFPAVAERLDGLVAVAQVLKTRQRDLEPAMNSGRLLGWVLLTDWRHPSTGSLVTRRGLGRVRNRDAADGDQASTEVTSTQPAVKPARHRARGRNVTRRSRRDLGSTNELEDSGEALAVHQPDDSNV